MYRVTPKGFEQLDGYLDLVAKDQLPFAAMLTINDLAFATRDEEMKVAARVFDRPKPQTVRNFFIKKATKSNLMATIWFNQIYADRFDEYMVPEVEGGSRQMKRSERMLSSFWIPGAGAKMDVYGNMQGGQITQILSQLQRFAEVGYSMNLNVRNERKRRAGSKGIEYFLVRTKHGGLVPGVYQRVAKAVDASRKGSLTFPRRTSRSLSFGAFQKGISSGPFSSVVRARGAMPVMIFTPQAPTYRKRFPFYETAAKVRDANLQKMFSARAAQALATARGRTGPL